MEGILARTTLKRLSRSIRAAAAALLALFLFTTAPTTPASAAAGDLDSSFGRGGRVTTDFGGAEGATAVAVQPDGKLVVAGSSSQPGGTQLQADFCVVRYKTDGSIDTSFGTDGRVLTDFGDTYDQALAVLVQPDGKIVVVGAAFSTGPMAGADFALARYNADGTPDKTFGTDGEVTTSFPSEFYSGATSAALQSDGRLVVAGIVYYSPTLEIYSSDFAVARYNADGTPDKTFGTDGLTTVDFSESDGAAGVVVQPDGRVVMAGSAWSITGNTGQPFGCAVARLNANGSPDSGFDGDGKTLINFLGQDWCSA
ncbi:MAG TPA: delta-60 repeat domain-containing protein, partial [Pyrinomonadaceae bacterium]